jgi:hypothetical protein
MTLKVIQSHIRPPLCQHLASTFVFGLTYSLSMPLYLFSLSHLLLSFSFPQTPYRLPPYIGIITTLQPQRTKKFLRGNSCSLSLSSPHLILLSLYASLSFLFLSYFFSVSIFSIPPPNPTLALYPPYASLSFLSPSFFFSLFVTLTYILMDNYLSLFYC